MKIVAGNFTIGSTCPFFDLLQRQQAITFGGNN